MPENEKNRVTVNILGQNYVVRGKEPADYIQSLAIKVDEKMRQLGKDSTLSTTQAAILIALNFADECEKLRKQHQELVKLLDEEWE